MPPRQRVKALAAPADDVDMLSDVVGSAGASRQPSALPSDAPSVAGDSDEGTVDPDAMDEDEKPADVVEGAEPKKLTAAQEAKLKAKEAKKAKQLEQEGRLTKRRKGVSKAKLADSIKRFEYLLGQTDLFQHFCDLKAQRDPAFAELLAESKAGLEAKKGKKGKGGESRRRKTEKEEDAELLADGNSNDGDDQPFVFDESPAYVKGGEMRDYQIQGLNWMISLHHNGINGILADEMGLGKTLQTISFLGYLKTNLDVAGPHLVVVPKSTLDNWSREFDHWVPGFRTIILRGTPEERKEMINDTILTQDFDVCITSYEICQKEKVPLKKLAWEYIIIDEAHRIKNVNSILSQIVREFDSRGRLLITGTPLQNNLHELWALLNFLLPDVFSNVEDFDRWFEARGGGPAAEATAADDTSAPANVDGEETTAKADESAPIITDEEIESDEPVASTSGPAAEDENSEDSVVKQLHKVLRPFLLRRVKADVEHSLLPKKEVNMYVGMTDMQRKWYRSLLEKDIDAVNGATGKGEGKTRLLNIVMQLRKCCNHPYLFDGAEPGPPFTTDEHLVFNSGKMIVLDKLLKAMQTKGSRVLIFSQMSRMLDILEDYCMFREYEYCRIDGSTSHEDRLNAIDEYNKPDSNKFVFLLTTRAGGLGINLTSADVVVLYDSDWNPQADLQAMDRAHRIGQKKQVYVFRFVTENAVEEKVLERAAQKLQLDRLVIQQGRATVAQKSADKDQILNMIQHGAEKILDTAQSMIVDEDIDEIINRGEARTTELQSKYQGLSIDDLANFKSESATTAWEGQDFAGKKAKVGIAWIEPTKRERKGANYANAPDIGEKRGTGPRAPRGLRPPNLDFQFMPTELAPLLEKENLWTKHEANYKVPLAEGKAAEGKSTEELEAERDRQQALVDNATPLTEDEEARREELHSKGFHDWHKKELFAFVRGAEKGGKKGYEDMAAEMGGSKTAEECEQYALVFFKRYREIEEGEKFVKRIEDAEAKRDQLKRTNDLIKQKVDDCPRPFQQLAIPYTSQTKGKQYTEEEDRFLLVHLSRLEYGVDATYDSIKNEICSWPAFRFDWFIKSRTPAEIGRRCTTLVGLIVKDEGGEDLKVPTNKGKAPRKPKAAATEASIAAPKGRKRKSDTANADASTSRASTPAGGGPSKSKKARK